MKPALIVGVALAALVSLPAPTWAQAKTDFSGSWIFDAARSDPAPPGGRRGGGGGGRGGGGVATSLSVTQTATQITIDRTMSQGATSGVYKLDASESTNSLGDVYLVAAANPGVVVTRRPVSCLASWRPRRETIVARRRAQDSGPRLYWSRLSPDSLQSSFPFQWPAYVSSHPV